MHWGGKVAASGRFCTSTHEYLAKLEPGEDILGGAGLAQC